MNFTKDFSMLIISFFINSKINFLIAFYPILIFLIITHFYFSLILFI